MNYQEINYSYIMWTTEKKTGATVQGFLVYVAVAIISLGAVGVGLYTEPQTQDIIQTMTKDTIHNQTRDYTIVSTYKDNTDSCQFARRQEIKSNPVCWERQ